MIETSVIFGVLAFIAHLGAYTWYAYGVFHERIRPNAASWLMWLIGGWVEYLTYSHIVGAHWSTSALPLACVIGLAGIFGATIVVQMRERARGTGNAAWHPPEVQDYFLVLFDLGALAIWLLFDAAEIANVIAVSTSIVTFIPIWRTTYRHPDKEHAGPWIVWSFAYALMCAAVFIEGGLSDGFGWRLFYPVYYFLLHITVVYFSLRRKTEN